MNLIIDRGNTRTKIALVNQGEIIHSDRFKGFDEETLYRYLSGQPKPLKAIYSSVADPMPSWLTRMAFPVLEMSHELNFPFQLDYETPHTLGLDRIALAAAAMAKYPNKDVLAIDAGTCLTYDLIEASGVYRGGAISPGLNMRFLAMHSFTARLPLVKLKDDAPLIGRSTEGSLVSGGYNGMIAEVNGIIDSYKSRYPMLITIITGGDGHLFGNLLKNSIFAAPNFLLDGLNNILEYNADRL